MGVIGPLYSQCQCGLMGLVGGIATVVLKLHMMWPVALAILSNSPGLCGFLRGSAIASHGDVPGILIWYMCIPRVWAVPVAACCGPGEY